MDLQQFEKNTLDRNAGKIEPASQEGSNDGPFRVKISDLDINLHTNNVRYNQMV